MNNWPIIKLGKVSKHRKEFINIDDLHVYKRCRVQSHVKGIVLRDEIEGARIKTKQQQVCRTNEFLVAEIDAKVGGYGIVPPELNSAIVSSHYFLFTIDESKLEPKFLGYYIKTPFFRDQVFAQGTTNYAAIRPQHVLDYTIPLPPLSEQWRIVAKIEQLAAKIEEARELRTQVREESAALLNTVSTKLFESLTTLHSNVSISKIISFRNDLIRPTDGKTGALRFIGLQHIESHTGKKIGEDRLLAEELTGRKFKFSPNEIVYGYLRPYLNKVWIADCDGFCSVDQYVIRSKSDFVDPKYLAYFMRSHAFLGQAMDLTHNLILPRLRTALLQSINIPLPPLDEQRRIVAYLDSLQAKVDRLKALQAQTAAELEALLPSVLDKAFKGEL